MADEHEHEKGRTYFIYKTTLHTIRRNEECKGPIVTLVVKDCQEPVDTKMLFREGESYLANKAGDDIDDKINCDYELDEMEKLLKS
jgi:hypothetical protein